MFNTGRTVWIQAILEQQDHNIWVSVDDCSEAGQVVG